MSIPLFSGEETIVTSNDKMTILTDMRIIVRTKSSLYYFFLEEIKSIKVYYNGDLYFLLAGIVMVFTMEQFFLNVSNNLTFLIIQIISCLLIFLFWWVFHRSTIVIISKSGKRLKIAVNKTAFKKIPNFIRKIELVKNDRLKELQGYR